MSPLPLSTPDQLICTDVTPWSSEAVAVIVVGSFRYSVLSEMLTAPSVGGLSTGAGGWGAGGCGFGGCGVGAGGVVGSTTGGRRVMVGSRHPSTGSDATGDWPASTS